MNNTEAAKPRVRGLYDWEIEEARCVFGSGFDYSRVRIHENDPFPNRIDQLGRKLKRLPPEEHNNAITLGNHCIFPVSLPEKPVGVDEPEHYKVCWLIHELTHAWQFQRQGWMYLVRALKAQFQEKAHVYEYGGVEGLKSRRKSGVSIKSFNLEQQGDIARDYYTRLRRGEDVTDYLPYIEEFQRTT